MIFNRRVVEAHQCASPNLRIAFAIPDHPWVDASLGAAVRIAMTVGDASVGRGILMRCIKESAGVLGEVTVEFGVQEGTVHADLRVGANVSAALVLRATSLLSNRGVIPHGAAFIVAPQDAALLGLGAIANLDCHIRPYRNGRDLTDRPRGVYVLDLFDLNHDEARSTVPTLYQWLLQRAKPERDLNPRPRRREHWWRFAEDQPRMRASIQGLERYIATGQVSKHRVFQWLDGVILPDDKLIVVASPDALDLGVLSSSAHLMWALAAGGRLGVGNDPEYSKTKCFETFPFPHEDTGLTPELTTRIRALAEQLDAHRKTQQAAHPELTLTGMYNVLERLRRAEPLTPKDKLIHTQGLVSVMKSLHDELDAEVLAAYGWADLQGALADHMAGAARAAAVETLLERLVALNAKRAAEEASGTVRWLRPEFQQRQVAPAAVQAELDVAPDDASPAPAEAATPAAVLKRPWPAGLPEQIKAVAEVLAASPRALALAELEARFNARGRWRERLPTILATLEALGRARQLAGGTARWQAS